MRTLPPQTAAVHDRLNDRDIILPFFPISWSFNKAACSAWFYKKTNNTPFKTCKADLNCQHEKLSSYSPLPVAPPCVKLTFTSPEVHISSFLWTVCTRNAKPSCQEGRFYLPERQTLAAEGLKHNLPTTSIADTSSLQGISIALVRNAHPWGKPNHILPSFLPLARPL